MPRPVGIVNVYVGLQPHGYWHSDAITDTHGQLGRPKGRDKRTVAKEAPATGKGTPDGYNHL